MSEEIKLVKFTELEKKVKKWKRHTIQDYFKMSAVLTHVRNNNKKLDALDQDYDNILNRLDLIEGKYGGLLEQIEKLKLIEKEEKENEI